MCLKKGEKRKMQIAKAKFFHIILAILLTLTLTLPIALSQVYPPVGTPIPTYAFINVAPNPIGVGQTATINFFLATPMETNERPTNMTLYRMEPDGTIVYMGNFTGDTTGGTFTTFTPTKAGIYKFRFVYLGQTLSPRSSANPFGGLVNQPSETDWVELTVKEEPVYEYAYPKTPLPTEYWETPVSAQNVENWYKITGPWLGLAGVTFAQTGLYAVNSVYNPYTESVYSGHVLWTKPWCPGGVVGGPIEGNQESGHYWSTRQYWPQYAPVIINGILYSTWYPETTGYSNGIVAVDIYTGETLFVINTTSVLRCGMTAEWKTVNMYGVVGPYIWTVGSLSASETGGIPISNVGTQYNMYSAFTGKYVLSVVNGTSMTLRTDAHGHLIGYYINSTRGTMPTFGPAPTFGSPPIKGTVNITTPVLCAFNMSQALGNSWGWGPSVNTVIDFRLGVMWAKPVPTEISGKPISPSLAINAITGDAVVMSGGYVHGQGVGGEVPGWLVVASMDVNTGNVLWLQNLTYPECSALLPFTRTTSSFGEGVLAIANDVNYKVVAYNVRTGNKLWEQTLKTPYGDGTPNPYDLFSLKSWVANGVMYWYGLGGDIWAFETQTGNLRWYTNTTTLIGDPGLETPYGIWPLWVFNCDAQTSDVAYFAIGHEYNPPLFHGAQMLALNASNGELIWSELGTYIRSAAVAYGKLFSLNAYDNMLYCFGKGPTKTTVSAPNIGVTTATPITITGSVTDISPGTQQRLVALKFPNGVPAVSEECQSKFMEYVYQQQVYPENVKGVEVTLSVLDSNNNFYDIGTTTTNADGTFSFVWTPQIPGKFMLTASFKGSNSYYGSSATTYFYASDAPPPSPPPTPQPASIADQYFIPAVIALFIAIIAIGVLMVLMLRKR